jgi:RNA polymerase sigma-70 factor (ECF subfamily)
VGIVRSYARGADESDLFQEILLQIWKGLPGFEGRSSRNTWVYRVALNTAMTYRRNESRRQSPTQAAPPTHSRSELEVLRLFLAGLNGADRAIFVMYLDDLSYQEMAAVTGLSVSHVGVKIHRMKQSFIDQYVTS